MLKQTISVLALIATVSCQSEQTSSNTSSTAETQSVSPEESTPIVDTTALDKHVLAHLYAAQALHSSDESQLTDLFDAVAFVETLLDIKEGNLGLAESNSMTDVIRLALSEEILHAVVEIVMESADINEDGVLDYDEFMNYRIGKWTPTPELDESINKWRQAAFPIVAGVDLTIDGDELLALLVMQRDYVMSLRSNPEDFRKLLEVTRDQFINNFDADGDGKIDRDELKDIRDAAKAERDRYLKKVEDLCADDENKEEPICKIELALAEACADAKDNSLLQRLCKSVLNK